MLRMSRTRLIRAGFKIFRKDENSRVIAQCSPAGSWHRVGKYTTKADLYRGFRLIMEDPKAIDV